MADAMVLATQKWLNEKYGNDSRFNKVAEDGITGWGIIYGLRRALQIEEKLPSLSNNFGQSTYAKCPTVKKGDTGNLVYIVQGGLWCKGYSPGGFNGVYGDGTYAAVQRFKRDAGFDDADGNINKDFMKALLDMSAFKLLSGGKEEIRTIQQQLNKDYYDFYQICPCNGLYDRDMNKMLIYALQKEEGIPKASATGTWGPSTISKCPTLELGKSSNVVKLVRYALVCNGISVSTSSKTYDSTLDEKAKEFAKLLKLNKKTNVIDYTIIKSLLSSNGDPNRSAKGCDTSTRLTIDQINLIKNSGYTHVGRYLTNTPGGTLDKKLTRTEYKNIVNAGLNLFFIFQEYGNKASKFTLNSGTEHANRALNAALSLGVPKNAVIYFAVDFDATDSEISKNIIPYFTAIRNSECSSYYNIGVYGTRNVCSRIKKSVGFDFYFVSDASYGFSGNLGYTMPDSWAFDQFKTDITLSNSTTSVNIDKVAVSYKDNGVSNMKITTENVVKNFLSALKMSDLFNVKIDYEKDQLVFLQGPDSIGNYISLQLKHDVSYDSSASGTLNIVEGEIKGSSLDDLTVDLKVNDDVKAEIKASVKEVVVTINHGSLSFSTQNVADRYSKGAIYVYTITAPVIDDKGLTSHVKLILTVKVAQDPQLDFAYDTLSEKDMAIARAFYTVAIIFGLSVTAGVGLSLIGKVLEGYGLPQTPIAVFKLCKLIAS